MKKIVIAMRHCWPHELACVCHIASVPRAGEPCQAPVPQTALQAGLSSSAHPGDILVIPREPPRGAWQPSVGGDGCLFFFLQAMQSLRKAISASSWCRLPAKVKQSLDGAEQLLCHRVSQFIEAPGALFGNIFSLFSLSPSFFGGSGQAGGAVCGTVWGLCHAWCCSHIWAQDQP